MTVKEFQSQWSKEINRIKRAIKRLESRGYTVDYELPERPKGIAPKQLQELRSETTHAKLIRRSTYVTKEGELISGYQAETRARKKSARKGQLTRKRKQFGEQQRRYKEWKEKKEMGEWKEKTLPKYSTIALENLRRQLESWSRGQQSAYSSIRNPVWKKAVGSKIDMSSTLLNLLETKIAELGERRMALQLETKASELNEALDEFIMASRQEQVQDASVRIATIINGASLSKQESEELTSQAESYVFSE